MANRKISIRYAILRAWVKLGLHIYFRDIEVSGKGNVPKNVPVLFAVNHPNTVLDALLTACLGPRHPWFMARGDVFEKKWLARLFRMMRMLPVFRERDGVSRVKDNAGVFSVCSRVLSRGGSLIIFPEGSHNREWRIRDLRRGLARIAMETVEHNQDLVIVPVGITYFDPKYAFSDVLVQFGKPIKAADYFDGNSHQVDQQNQLMAAVGEQLEQLTLHIGESDYDSIYERVKYLEQNEKEEGTLLADFNRLQGWIDQCKKNPKLGVRPEDHLIEAVKRKGFPLIALVVTAPLWLAGKVFAIVPQLLIMATLKKIKDDHFTGAVRFGIGIISYTIVFIGIGIWAWLSSMNAFWFVLKWAFYTFCIFFVMLWEEHWQNFRGRRFSRS